MDEAEEEDEETEEPEYQRPKASRRTKVSDENDDFEVKIEDEASVDFVPY